MPLVLSVNLSRWQSLRKDRLDCGAADRAAAAFTASARTDVAPGAWAVLARNLIPVVGIYCFGWSAALAVFNYWFDGLSALAAIVAALIPRALRETQPKSIGAMSVAVNIVRGVLTWIFLVGIVGLPVLDRTDSVARSAARRRAAPPARAFSSTLVHLWLACGRTLWKAFQSGYDAMPDKELKQRVRWDVYLLVLRAMAMFIMAAHGLAFILVPLMALLLSYFEIWPDRALGAVFGDPSRL